MKTTTDIANMALARINISPITSLTDGGELAKKIAPVWNSVFETFLTAHDWSFATKYDIPAQLPVDGIEAPPYPNAFAYPEDCVKLHTVLRSALHSDRYALRRPQARYAVARYGDKRKQAIYADAAPVVVKYTSNRALLDDFSPDAVDALVYKLAAEIALNIKNATQRASELIQRYQVAFDAAVRGDLKTTNDVPLGGDEYSRARL